MLNFENWICFVSRFAGFDIRISDWVPRMLPKELRESLQQKIARTDHPRELAVDVMLALQNHYGYLSDEALEEGASLLGMTPLELEELATFYDFIYREPVGKYVIHICDGVVCWMNGYRSIVDYLCKKLGVEVGETTADGLFTILPTACIGYCDLSPAILIGRRAYGPLTPKKIDEILEDLKNREQPLPGKVR
jgi:NADH-quinone oxidoreductase subunit E